MWYAWISGWCEYSEQCFYMTLQGLPGLDKAGSGANTHRGILASHSPMSPESFKLMHRHRSAAQTNTHTNLMVFTDFQLFIFITRRLFATFFVSFHDSVHRLHCLSFIDDLYYFLLNIPHPELLPFLCLSVCPCLSSSSHHSAPWMVCKLLLVPTKSPHACFGFTLHNCSLFPPPPSSPPSFFCPLPSPLLTSSPQSHSCFICAQLLLFSVLSKLQWDGERR